MFVSVYMYACMCMYIYVDSKCLPNVNMRVNALGCVFYHVYIYV